MEKKMRLFRKSPAAAEDKTKVQISLSQIMLRFQSETPISIRSRQILIFHLHAFSKPVLVPWHLLTHFQDRALKRLWRSRLCGVEVWVLWVWRVRDVYLHDFTHCNYLKGKAAFPALSNEYVVLHHQQPPSAWLEGNYYYSVGCFSKGAI